MAQTFKIAGVQIDIAIGVKQRNLEHMEEMLREAAWEGAHLVVFPECALTGYCFDSLEEARPFAESIVPGTSAQYMTELCRELGTYVVFGILESDGDRVYNACVLVGPEGVIGDYRKVHLPFLGVDRFVNPGDRPFQVWSAGGLKIGMNICYDGSFPEASRSMALDGADLIVLPTNWPPAAACFAAHTINTRAMENNVYYMSVNRVGKERGISFIGQSRICAPDGQTITEANDQAEQIIYSTIDVERARNKHLVRVPAVHEIDRFLDRRPEFYGRLVEPVAKVIELKE